MEYNRGWNRSGNLRPDSRHMKRSRASNVRDSMAFFTADWEEVPMDTMRMTRRSLMFPLDMDMEAKGKDKDENVGDGSNDILEQQIRMPTPKVGYFQIYRYASRWDWALLVLGGLCAIGGGAALPLFTVLLSFQHDFIIVYLTV